MSKILLNEKQVFDAMVAFVEIMNEQFGWVGLSSLLGSMVLVDGAPLDAAIWTDWNEAVRRTFQDTSAVAEDSIFSIEKAYCAVFEFLSARYKSGEEDINLLLKKINSGEFSAESELWTEWRLAIRAASNSLDEKAAVIVKDGLSYEMHVEKGKSS